MFLYLSSSRRPAYAGGFMAPCGCRVARYAGGDSKGTEIQRFRIVNYSASNYIKPPQTTLT